MIGAVRQRVPGTRTSETQGVAVRGRSSGRPPPDLGTSWSSTAVSIPDLAAAVRGKRDRRGRAHLRPWRVTEVNIGIDDIHLPGDQGHRHVSPRGSNDRTGRPDTGRDGRGSPTGIAAAVTSCPRRSRAGPRYPACQWATYLPGRPCQVVAVRPAEVEICVGGTPTGHRLPQVAGASPAGRGAAGARAGWWMSFIADITAPPAGGRNADDRKRGKLPMDEVRMMPVLGLAFGIALGFAGAFPAAGSAFRDRAGARPGRLLHRAGADRGT